MNTRNLLGFCIGGTVCLLTLSVAWAQDTSPPMPPGPPHHGAPGMFMPRPEDLNANEDGFVTLDEFTTACSKAVKAQFARMDTNADGKLNKDERSKRQGPRSEGGPRPRNGLRDSDSSGRGSEAPAPPADSPGVASRPKPPRTEDLDTDLDGVVTLYEFSTGWDKFNRMQFTCMDANADGELSQDELPKPPGHGPEGGPPRKPGDQDWGEAPSQQP